MSKLFQIQLEIAGRMGAGLVSAFSSTSAQMNVLSAQSAALRGNLKTLDSAYIGVHNTDIMKIRFLRNIRIKML
jgi:hypothetical protein